MTGKDVIRELMEERGITNAQLAEKMGVTQAVVWARLSNEVAKDVTLPIFYEMARALDYEVVVRPRHEKYVDGTEHILDIEVQASKTRTGRPKKTK